MPANSIVREEEDSSSTERASPSESEDESGGESDAEGSSSTERVSPLVSEEESDEESDKESDDEEGSSSTEGASQAESEDDDEDESSENSGDEEKDATASDAVGGRARLDLGGWIVHLPPEHTGTMLGPIAWTAPLGRPLAEWLHQAIASALEHAWPHTSYRVSKLPGDACSVRVQSIGPGPGVMDRQAGTLSSGLSSSGTDSSSHSASSGSGLTASSSSNVGSATSGSTSAATSSGGSDSTAGSGAATASAGNTSTSPFGCDRKLLLPARTLLLLHVHLHYTWSALCARAMAVAAEPPNETRRLGQGTAAADGTGMAAAHRALRALLSGACELLSTVHPLAAHSATGRQAAPPTVCARGPDEVLRELLALLPRRAAHEKWVGSAREPIVRAGDPYDRRLGSVCTHALHGASARGEGARILEELHWGTDGLVACVVCVSEPPLTDAEALHRLLAGKREAALALLAPTFQLRVGGTHAHFTRSWPALRAASRQLGGSAQPARAAGPCATAAPSAASVGVWARPPSLSFSHPGHPDRAPAELSEPTTGVAERLSSTSRALRTRLGASGRALLTLRERLRGAVMSAEPFPAEGVDEALLRPLFGGATTLVRARLSTGGGLGEGDETAPCFLVRGRWIPFGKAPQPELAGSGEQRLCAARVRIRWSLPQAQSDAARLLAGADWEQLEQRAVHSPRAKPPAVKAGGGGRAPAPARRRTASAGSVRQTAALRVNIAQT